MFDPKAKTYYFFAPWGGMCRKARPWNHEDVGQGDSVARTALAYILYGGPILYTALMCRVFHTERGIVFSRYPGAPDTFSRDQLAMMLVSFKLRGHDPIFVYGLKCRISKKHWMTPDLWLWIRATFFGSKLSLVLWQVITIVQLSVAYLWNPFMELLYDLTHVRILRKARLEVYALLIMAWQVHCIPDGFLTRVIKRLGREVCPAWNLVIYGLFGGKVYPWAIDYFKEERDCLWGSDDPNVPIPGVEEFPDDTNDLDLELLKYVQRLR